VKVGFRADEEQYVGAVAVATVAKLDLGPGQLGRNSVHDARNGPTSPLVDEVLGVEGGEYFSRRRLQQRGDRRTGADAGVNPALQSIMRTGSLRSGSAKKMMRS